MKLDKLLIKLQQEHTTIKNLINQEYEQLQDKAQYYNLGAIKLVVTNLERLHMEEELLSEKVNFIKQALIEIEKAHR